MSLGCRPNPATRQRHEDYSIIRSVQARYALKERRDITDPGEETFIKVMQPN